MQKLIYVIDIFAARIYHCLKCTCLNLTILLFFVSLDFVVHTFLVFVSHSVLFSYFPLRRFQHFGLIIHWRKTLAPNDKVFIRAEFPNEITKAKLTQQA